MQMLSRAGGFYLFSSNLTFLAGTGVAKSLIGAFLSFLTLASTLPTFTSAGKAAFGLCPSGLHSMTLLTILFWLNSNSWIIVRLFLKGYLPLRRLPLWRRNLL